MTWVIAALVLSARAPASAAVLRGRVAAKPRVEAAQLSRRGDYGARALRYAVPFDYRRLKRVVVYAQPVGPPAPGAAPGAASPGFRVVETRRGLAFEPSFLAAPIGSEIWFENRSAEALSLFAGGTSAASMDLELAPGERKSVRVRDQGLFLLRCLQTSQASARFFAGGAFVARADPAGRYSLELPPGRYQVTAWHERLPPETQEVELSAVETRDLDFLLSVSSLPEVR